MVLALKQGTAVTIKLGPFVDETDGKTAETALTISQADVRLSKNGGNMAQKNEASACTHDEIGMYDCPLDATDTDTLGILTVNVHESGALPVKQEYMVLPANVYDSFFSTDKLEVDVAQFGGTNLTASGGRPEVNTTHWGGTAVASAVVPANVIQISGDATSADNLESYTDGTTPMPVNATQISGSGTAADNVETAFASTLAEPASVPAANAPLWTAIKWLFLKSRNKITQTATTQTLFADDGSTPVATSTVSDDGTTATRGEFS